MLRSQDSVASVGRAPVSTDRLALLTFTVDGQVYGLPVTKVVQIIEMVTLTYLPQAPKPIQGIINWRGQVVSIMDLRLRFELAFQAYGLHTPIILTDFGDRLLGLITDSVDEVLEIAPTDLEPIDALALPKLANNQSPFSQITYLAGVAKVERRLIPTLKLSAILTEIEQAQLKRALRAKEIETQASEEV